jgi:hypothetical protein
MSPLFQLEVYTIRVVGKLDHTWEAWFEGMQIRPCSGDETEITGPIQDQAALFGLLLKIRDLGLPLLELKRMDN